MARVCGYIGVKDTNRCLVIVLEYSYRYAELDSPIWLPLEGYVLSMKILSGYLLFVPLMEQSDLSQEFDGI